MKYALGIDLGATNIKALAVSLQGRVLLQTSLPTNDTGTPEWKQNVLRVADKLSTRMGAAPACIGLAAPGLAAKDHRSIVSMPGRLTGLEGLVWQEFFKTRRTVPVLNDAQAALLGEVWCGAARGTRNAMLLTLGTGVGGAALVDGHLLRGHLGRAGHLGHISLDPEGGLDIVRTPGSLEEAIGDYTVKLRSQGRFASTQALVAASKTDPEAQCLWLKSVQALSAGIASLINVLDPEVVVIGGGIARAGHALFDPLKKFLDCFEWRPSGARVRVVAAKLGERAGALGAAWKAIHVHD
jgi:glucokinase